MKLHIFNPEHDIALAANLANFTAPHAGRQLRSDLGFLPALWAADDEAVLVENVEQARRRYARIRSRVRGGQPRFVDLRSLARLGISGVEPWGWDLALRAQLLRYGVTALPDEEQIRQVRLLSHRRTAAQLLPQLRIKGTVGEAFECKDEQSVEELLAQYGRLVMKAPWSSSGRGLRFLSLERTPFCMQAGWFRNVVRTQGSVMVEPFYQKVKDFGMEFRADDSGRIHYEGLSLFHTQNGAYVGNVIATEHVKREMLCRYVTEDLLHDIRSIVCSRLSLGGYVGPFGVDMMVVKGESRGFLLHPCVEINLRRTMGHVALALTPEDDELRRVMRIELTDNYKLRIRKL